MQNIACNYFTIPHVKSQCMHSEMCVIPAGFSAVFLCFPSFATASPVRLFNQCRCTYRNTLAVSLTVWPAMTGAPSSRPPDRIPDSRSSGYIFLCRSPAFSPAYELPWPDRSDGISHSRYTYPFPVRAVLSGSGAPAAGQTAAQQKRTRCCPAW